MDCGEIADENRNKGVAVDIVCKCETIPFVDKIKKQAENRNDEIRGA